MKNKHISLVVLVVIIYGLDALSTDQNVIVKAKRQMCIGGGSCHADRPNNHNYNWGKRDVGVVTKNETQNDLPIVKRQMCVGGGSCSSDRANNYNYNYGKRDVAEVATNETNDLLKVKRNSPYVMQQLANKQNSKRSVNKRQMCVGGGSCSSDRANNYNYNWGKRDVGVVTKNETKNDLPIVKRQMCVGGGSCSSDRANNYNYNYGKRDVAEVVTNETNDLLKVKRSASPEKVIKDLIPNQNSKRYADRFNNNNNPNVAGSYCDCDDQGQRCNCWNGK